MKGLKTWPNTYFEQRRPVLDRRLRLQDNRFLSHPDRSPGRRFALAAEISMLMALNYP
jgi:hypothetical protein